METLRPASGPAAVIIFLLGLLLLAPGSGRSAPDGDAPGDTAAAVSDAVSFARELHAGGAVKFYENTEDLLRAGQFERALLRYAFLKGQIAGQAGYRPLVTMVNQRLHFLEGQLRLPAQEFTPLKAPRLRRQPPAKAAAAQAAAPASPKPQVQPGDDGKEGDNVHPAEAGLPAGASNPPPPGSPAAASPPPSPDSQPKPEKAQVEEEKPPEPPPPPPSRWQRLKKRLLFWRK